jgi:hypothetical protein
MKNYLILAFVTLMLVSCSQQQFAFRKKIAVNQTDKVTLKTQPHKTIDNTSNIEASEQIAYNEPVSFVAQQEELVSTNVSVLPEDTIRKKYRFEEDRSPSNASSGSDPKNGDYDSDSKADKDALIGFILGIVGAFIIPITAIPGLIYSIRGLKSYKRKGLATAGVVINAVVILLLLFFILLIITFISSF